MSVPIPAVEAYAIEVAPPNFPSAPPDELFRLQLELIEVDGTRASLSQYRGFRNLVVARCNEMSLDGYVWRVPRTRAKILARGTASQIEDLLRFCHFLRSDGYIRAYVHQKPEFHIVINGFAKLPSNRRHVLTGDFSDPRDDEVASTSSAGTPILRGPPSPHDL
jgi:hypothetical protein